MFVYIYINFIYIYLPWQRIDLGLRMTSDDLGLSGSFQAISPVPSAPSAPGHGRQTSLVKRLHGPHPYTRSTQVEF
jgi:hypothetical protein